MSDFLDEKDGGGGQGLTSSSHLDFRPTQRELMLREWLLRDVLASPAYVDHKEWIANRLIIDGFTLPYTSLRNVPAAPAEPVTLLQTIELGGAGAFDFTGISQEYNHLEIVGDLRGNTASFQAVLAMTFNGDTGANYDYSQAQIAFADTFATSSTGANFGHAGYANAASSSANRMSPLVVKIPNYANSTRHKGYVSQSSATDSGNYLAAFGGGHWRSTAAITQVTITAGAGSWIAGSRLTLHGIL